MSVQQIGGIGEVAYQSQRVVHVSLAETVHPPPPSPPLLGPNTPFPKGKSAVIIFYLGKEEGLVFFGFNEGTAIILMLAF